MQKFSKYLLSLAIISLLTLPMLAMAQVNYGIGEINNGINGSMTVEDPRTVIGRIITIALGFLGVIAVVIIILAGFKWMTSGGNEEKASEAKKLMGAGVIGLVIILMAWAIATFIFNSLNSATNMT